MRDTAPTPGAALCSLVRHPVTYLVRGWNWKAAVVSAICRAGIFLAANLPAGIEAGLAAMSTEVVFRIVVSGSLGSATQAVGTVSSAGRSMMVALLVIPVAGHLAEYAVHRLAGTARLGHSSAASVAFSLMTTAFNVFAMRRGALIVGEGAASLAADLSRMPALIAAFVRALARSTFETLARGRRMGGEWLFRRCT